MNCLYKYYINNCVKEQEYVIIEVSWKLFDKIFFKIQLPTKTVILMEIFHESNR